MDVQKMKAIYELVLDSTKANLRMMSSWPVYSMFSVSIDVANKQYIHFS